MTSVIAHRGASRRRPENSIAAFRVAAELGADAVELDVRQTADGALVVRHDATLPDGRAVSELESAALPPEVPDLVAALDASAGMWINVEIKNAPGEPGFDPTDEIAVAVIETLARWGHPERILISSFRRETVARCRSVAPHIRTALLCYEADDQAIGACVGDGHGAIHPYAELLTRAGVERCHAQGLQVNTWTCNDPARMRELASWGVDGIVTDVPDELIEVLGGSTGRVD